MKIWVDADACPAAIRKILYKAAERTQIPLTLVANNYFSIPKSSSITFVRVPPGQDTADNRIVNNLAPGDLVITGDIPLAARILKKGGLALNPRGEVYSEDTIQERLSTRDFLDSLRSIGIETGGPAAPTSRDKQAFANSLDRLLRNR